MEMATLMDLLKRTLDPAQREAAEQELKKVEKIIGFCPSLLQIIMNEGVETPVRQSGAIYFKNLVGGHWVDNNDSMDPKEAANLKFSIHEQDRALIRDNLVEANVRAPEVLRLQLSICISMIVKHDYPARWPQVVDKISIYLQNPNPAEWPGALAALYQLVKTYEYKKKEERTPLYEAMNLLLPQVYNVAKQCQADPLSQPAAEIRKQILKIFFALTQYVLPLELLGEEFFTQWMEVCRDSLMRDIPPGVEDGVELDERPEIIWWKEKKWALHIVARIFERYGSPGNVMPEYKKFSEWYMKTFSSGILSTILQYVMAKYAGEGCYVSPRVLQLALNYVNTAVSHAVSWKVIKPHVLTIVRDVVFRLMSYTPQDQELWESDPYEYVRVKFDIFEDFVSPVTAAQTLLNSLCKKRKDTLQQTMDFLSQVLGNQATPPAQKDGALHMIGTLADVLLKKKEYKGKMEEFLVQIVFPEFNSQFGHLRARACWMLHYFAEVKYKNQNVLVEAYKLTINALLNDPEVPVKVEAAIALQMMLSNHEEVARPLVEPQIGNITIKLLEIIRDTENDDLTTVMQKIICTYTEQLMPMAQNIADHIVTSFIMVLESNDGGDEKAITAMGLLNTLETLISVLEEEADSKAPATDAKKVNAAHALLEPIVLRAVNHVFSNSVAEFYEEALTLACDLTSTTISADMWKVLESVYNVYNNDGADYFIDMMPLLHNYVTVDTDAFLSNPAYAQAMLAMCKNMFESAPGEDPECHAAKLLEVIILQCKGRNVHELVSSSVHLALSRLQGEIKTSELRTMCIQVAIAALHYDAENFTSSFNNNPAVLAQFVDQWINDTDCFIGIHDRKLCILGLCQLLTRPDLPGVKENAARIVPSLILLFDGLKRAYENAQDSDDEDDSDGEEDDDEDDDGELLESDEDEIDEESQVYLESLQKKVMKSPAGGGVSSPGDGTQPPFTVTSATVYDDDDSDDDDLFDENNLEAFTTPLDEDDAVDEYQIFKNTLAGLEANPQAKEWYVVVTGGLTADQGKSVQEIYTLCDQRRAAKESQKIQESGGYNFAQNVQVDPTKFAFTNNGSNFTFGK